MAPFSPRRRYGLEDHGGENLRAAGLRPCHTGRRRQAVPRRDVEATTSSPPMPRRRCPKAPHRRTGEALRRRHRGNAQDAVTAEEAVDTFTLRRRHAIAFLELHAVLELWSTTEPCPHRRV
jgi:hypothetical protein